MRAEYIVTFYFFKENRHSTYFFITKEIAHEYATKIQNTFGGDYWISKIENRKYTSREKI
jgi:hypothetical protein